MREDHTGLGAGSTAVAADGRAPEAEDALVAVDLESGEVSVLARGYDFYSTPRPSPDGAPPGLAELAPPEHALGHDELWLADVDESGTPVDPRLIAGGGDESVVQPEWSPDGSLVFVSDRTGWWNLYRSDRGRRCTPLAPMEAEFAGAAVGLWSELVRHRARRDDRRQCRGAPGATSCG